MKSAGLSYLASREWSMYMLPRPQGRKEINRLQLNLEALCREDERVIVGLIGHTEQEIMFTTKYFQYFDIFPTHIF